MFLTNSLRVIIGTPPVLELYDNLNFQRRFQAADETAAARSIMPMPPGPEGGFEKEYIEALKTFVQNGGIVMILQ